LPLRLEKGLELYKTPGAVNLICTSPGLLEFLVKGSNPGEFYEVYCLDDNWLCTCKDFMNRHQRQDKTFICKHISASIWHYMGVELNCDGVTAQTMEATS